MKQDELIKQIREYIAKEENKQHYLRLREVSIQFNVVGEDLMRVRSHEAKRIRDFWFHCQRVF